MAQTPSLALELVGEGDLLISPDPHNAKSRLFPTEPVSLTEGGTSHLPPFLLPETFFHIFFDFLSQL